jgi:hypothetical protein
MGMNDAPPVRDKKSYLAPILGVLLAAMLVLALWQARNADIHLEDVLGNLVKKSEILSQMKADLLKSVEAEKNAVMADTDEESEAFAKLAFDASNTVETNRKNLEQLIQTGRAPDEIKLIGEFDTCWDEFRKIDRELLDFAVRNTNLKAARLSFTKGRDAVKRFQASLTALIDGNATSPEGPQIAKLAFQAVSGAYAVYSLEAPHIVESSDQKMDEIETAMAKAVGEVRTALYTVGGIAGERNRTQLGEAQAALADFLKINEEVVKLSRQNTNIRSMELSLGAKRKVTAQCMETLTALQEVVRSTTFKATR